MVEDMKNVDFVGSNTDVAKRQTEYLPLRAITFPDDPNGTIITCFELSDDEIAHILKTKTIFHSQLTFGGKMQPIRMAVNLEDIL